LYYNVAARFMFLLSVRVGDDTYKKP